MNTIVGKSTLCLKIPKVGAYFYIKYVNKVLAKTNSSLPKISYKCPYFIISQLNRKNE